MIVIGSSLQGIRTSCQENGSAESQLGPTGNNILAMYNSAKKKAPDLFVAPLAPNYSKLQAGQVVQLIGAQINRAPTFQQYLKQH